MTAQQRELAQFWTAASVSAINATIGEEIRQKVLELSILNNYTPGALRFLQFIA